MNFIFQFFEKRLNPYPENHIPLPRDSMIKFLWACTYGLRKWLFLLMFLTAGVGIYEAMLYKWVGDLVDWLGHYTPAELWQQHGTTIWLMAGVLLISPFWVGLNSLIHFQVLQGVFPMQMRWRFHKAMLGQSIQFYQDEFSGRVSAKVMQTALAVRETIMTLANMMVYVSVYFITTGVILFNLDGLLLIPFVAWLILFIVVLKFFIPRLQKAAITQADARALMTGRITDAYANINTVKLFSHSRRELSYAKDAMQQFMHTVHGQMRWVSVLEVVNHSMSVLLVGGTAVIGLYLWSQGNATAGALAVAMAMALRLNGLTHWIMWQTASLFENFGTVQDGMRTLATPQTVIDCENAHTLNVQQGKIDFNSVDFSYLNAQGQQENLLNQFCLNIKAGEKIGLIGQSGAGKSTLVNLLLRFYDIQGGQILVDGQNIAQVSQESLRQNIGMVTQDTSLLHRTIRENIAYGRPDATDDEIIQAAKQAQAWDFIQQLSDNQGNTGLDTQVGERGVKLSGGQRQRIAIARVMLKNAPILLLDEATSALDSEVEHAITESLTQMMQGKTVIAIAHRLSTIAELDRLVVLERGQIVEQGSHDELLAQNGVYARLWQRQTGGFLGDVNE
ncbi:ABC transporter ATP-binding protein [Moraxella sp. ZY210820]|uniref:ABC transporter ATP-binding protein n=1 Tax=unclassified Moraxella TaxID=2685852 RepID=UPI00272FC6AC|nr:ABC transporter ATP-binding protein [Moraxella sp. ZY210820]WLF84542.1 ABC transporter ATP-binding protein/permease [Moraxella sp. ZY210820]